MTQLAGVSQMRKTPMRQGALLVVVLALLTVASTLSMVGFTTALRHRRQVAKEVHALQASELLRAGLRRALASCRDDTNYDGETWDVTDALPQFNSATIRIDVTPLASQEPPSDQDLFSRKRIDVSAELQPRAAEIQVIQRSLTYVTNNS